MMTNVTLVVQRRWQGFKLGIPPSLRAKLGTAASGELTLNMGSFNQKVNLVKVNSKVANRLYISPLIAKATGLKTKDRIRAKCSKDKLILGPLIGIFADYVGVKGKPFGEPTKFLQELAQAAREEHYFVYVFDSHDVNWQKQKVNGFVLGTNKEGETVWVRRLCPFPQVVYDRFLGLRLRAFDKKVKSRILNSGIPLFNRPMGDKWLSHLQFVHNSNLVGHLPQTNEFRPELIEPWLDRFTTIYVKPRLGTQGKGIIRVSKQQQGYEAQCVAGKGKLTYYRTKSINLLRRKIVNWVNGQRYIIQRGIPLAMVQGRHFDVRVLAQKGNMGKWKITGMVARVGQKGSAISNVHGGGEVMEVTKAVNLSFNQNTYLANQILQELEQVSVEVCNNSEKEGFYLGELGIDLGVDVNGKVWYIEVNPKPGRSVFSRLNAYDLRKQSVVQPMHYAAYLAEFSAPQAGEGVDTYDIC